MIKVISIVLMALLLCGCGQELPEKEIEERNAKSRAEVSKQTSTSDGIKSSGNVIAIQIGGEATIELPPKQKLVSVTWKGKNDSMWFLYRPFRDGEKPETYIYQEDSMWGLMEATIVIKESE
jgi:hypothetical protein